MAFTIETINGVKCVTTDNDGVPIDTLTANGGNVMASAAKELSEERATSRADAYLVKGPASAADNVVMKFDGTSGKLAKQADWTSASAAYGGIDHVQLLATNAATDVWAVLTPKGTGGVQAQVADGTAAGGNVRGVNAVDWQTNRGVNGQVASGAYSHVGGGRSNTASGSYSTVGGGNTNTASGNYSTVSGFSNTASGVYSTVSGGFSNNASGYSSTVGGGYTNTASAASSTVGGGQGNTASADYSTVGGGQANTANVSKSTIGGGYTNTASAIYATVSGGYTNTASGDSSTVGGGYTNTASAASSTVGGGQGNTASGIQSTVSGGPNNTASGEKSTVSGGYAAVANKYGQNAYASGMFAAVGDAQVSLLVARAATTDATATNMFLDGVGDKLVIPVDTAWFFDVQIVAAKQSMADCKMFHRTGLITNDASTITLSTVNTIGTDQTIGTITATVALTADGTDDALDIQVTGAAATNIRWVARVHLTEVSYPA